MMVFPSCKTRHENNVAITDFRTSLQPHLVKLVSKGCVYHGEHTKYIEEHATDDELRQLSRSENPVLRAFAFRVMLERPSFNHFEIIMNNLDDSAIVATDDKVGREGLAFDELQIEFSRVSEYLLTHATWKDSIARAKTVDEVIFNHNYLHSAYEKLMEIPADEKYYPYIRKMLQRESPEDYIFQLLGERDYEYALYGMEKFKKPTDTPFLNEALKHNWRLSSISFRIMEEYPNDAYLDILEEYYRKDFYDCSRFYWRDVDWFSSTISFISSIASYKNDRSALILDSILNRKPFMPCIKTPDYIEWIRMELVDAILDNPCPAYLKIRTQIENGYGKIIKEHIEHRGDPEPAILRSNSSEPISWR